MLHAARWKYMMQNDAKNIIICPPSHNFIQLYLRN